MWCGDLWYKRWKKIVFFVHILQNLQVIVKQWSYLNENSDEKIDNEFQKHEKTMRSNTRSFHIESVISVFQIDSIAFS